SSGWHASFSPFPLRATRAPHLLLERTRLSLIANDWRQVTTTAEVLGLIKEKDIKFVDFRFSHTKGKEQHVTVPARVISEEVFEDGKMFDGSSIAGWEGINESDMIVLPHAESAVVDVFAESPSV